MNELSSSRRRHSVVGYVFVSFAVCLVAIGLVLATTTAAAYAREQRLARQDLIASATFNANLETEGLDQVVGVLSGLAEQEAITSLDTAQCASAFQGLESVADQGSLYLLAPNGTPVCSLLARRRPVADVPTGAWFERVQTTRAPQYGGIRIEAATRTPQAVFAVPVSSGSGTAVLVAVLDSAIPALEAPPSAPDTVLIEVDKARRVVISRSANAPVALGPIPADSWLRSAARGTRTDTDGTVRMYETVEVEGLDRMMLAGVARSTALQAATDERDRNLLLGAAILVLVLSLGAVVQRRIARPVAHLQSAIRDAGDDGTVQANLAGPAEIHALAEEFNATMAKRHELEVELAASVSRAEEASRMKSLFLANVSHEIRTPMNGVVGMLSLLDNDSLTPTQRDYVETMRDSAGELTAIIDDLLDFSKIEAGLVQVVQVAFVLRSTVHAAVAPWEAVAAAKGIELQVVVDDACPDTVGGDPLRLRQVLSNLVDNAVKFTGAGRVELLVRPLPNAQLRFEVRDTGIGIPPGANAELFDAFVQADPTTTRRFGGTGLGLAICKQLVTLMHGRIGASPRPEGGSRFWFELPLPAVAGAASGDTNPETAKGAVLLAEDNVINQKVASTLVRQFGYEVDIAGNGADAVAMVGERDCLAVLMDLQMPVMDGIDAAREIRQTVGSSVPIIALSASVLAEDVARCHAVGMNGHLGKPIDRAALRFALEQAIGA